MGNLIISKVREYFIQVLGYSPSNIRENVRNKGYVADLVIWDGETPYILVEVKGKNLLPKQNEIKFEPSVAQAQKLAVIFHAQYYVVTDGETFLWFSTDEIGRPSIIEEPIHSSVGIKKIYNKRELVYVLKRLKVSYSLYPDTLSVELVILAWILSEKNITSAPPHIQLHNYLESKRLNLSSNQDYSFNQRIDEGVKALESFNIKLWDRREILKVFDEVFFDKRGYIRISRGISDFLVRLLELDGLSEILDLSNSFGNIINSVSLMDKPICCLHGEEKGRNNEKEVLWNHIQGLLCDNVRVVYDSFEYKSASLLESVTNVIAVPPVGKYRGDYFRSSELAWQGVTDIEALVLENVINRVKQGTQIVAIVPNRLLSGGGKRRITREYLHRVLDIQAIISLDGNGVIPNTGIKSSIILARKMNAPLLVDRQIIMAVITSALGETYDCREYEDVNFLLKAVHEKNKIISDYSRFFWTVRSSQINEDNITVESNRAYDELKIESLNFDHRMVNLDEVCLRIDTGPSIKLNSQGSIPIIGAAAIRPMVFQSKSVSFTSVDNLSNRQVTVQPGDILFNNVGSHLGDAAVAEESILGTQVNNSVVVIRPNTSLIIPEFLAAIINHEFVKVQIHDKSSGIIRRMSLKGIRELKIPLPSIQTQQQIVEEIKNAQIEYVRAEEEYRKAQAKYLYSIQHLSAVVSGEDK
ncbi:MAG: restriction modification system specificity domain protein [Firmicutes bacterium]|nr:restriction modification system specificity domain protein [Bacillota bacterium]